MTNTDWHFISKSVNYFLQLAILVSERAITISHGAQWSIFKCLFSFCMTNSVQTQEDLIIFYNIWQTKAAYLYVWEAGTSTSGIFPEKWW